MNFFQTLLTDFWEFTKFVSRVERERQFFELTERVHYSNENQFFVILF